MHRDLPAPTYGNPFNMPTDCAFASNGDVYVSDGYGNHRDALFLAHQQVEVLLGRAGTDSSRFAIVHFIQIDEQDRVWITDRDNHRIQTFDNKGKFLAEWKEFQMPSDLAFGLNRRLCRQPGQPQHLDKRQKAAGAVGPQ